MKKMHALLIAVLAALVTSLAFATDPTTLAELTTGISFTNATTAALAVTALIIGFLVLKQGAGVVMQFVRKLR